MTESGEELEGGLGLCKMPPPDRDYTGHMVAPTPQDGRGSIPWVLGLSVGSPGDGSIATQEPIDRNDIDLDWEVTIELVGGLEEAGRTSFEGVGGGGDR